MKRKITLQDLERLHKNAQLHWFDDDTMKQWQTTFHSPVYDGSNGLFFVTHNVWDNKKGYTIRQFDDDCHISTIGAFQAFSSAKAARSAAKKAAG